MTEAPFLSVVLPCRNQQDHIAGVVASYVPSLEGTGRTFEIVVVPNACTDGTAAAAAEISRRDPRVRVVELAEGGWGRAVLAGLGACRGEVLCYTNSARTDPADVARLLDLYLASAPCLAKVRRVKRNAARRELGSWLYNLEGRVLFGIRARDVNGTPKILSREAYRRLAPESLGDLIDMEILAAATREGIPIVEMEVAGFKRHGGRSSTNLRSAWGMYVGALRLRSTLARRGRSSAAPARSAP